MLSIRESSVSIDVPHRDVFGVFAKVSFKAVSSATETFLKFGIYLHMIFSNKRITKALRLHGCVGWSAPVLLANH